MSRVQAANCILSWSHEYHSPLPLKKAKNFANGSRAKLYSHFIQKKRTGMALAKEKRLTNRIKKQATFSTARVIRAHHLVQFSEI